jgi:hypothetical protein
MRRHDLGHHVVDGVKVEPEAIVLVGIETTSGLVPALEQEHFVSRSREVGGADQTVRPAADIVVAARPRRSRIQAPYAVRGRCRCAFLSVYWSLAAPEASQRWRLLRATLRRASTPPITSGSSPRLDQRQVIGTARLDGMSHI